MSSKQLSTEDQVIHTEIVWYLDIIDFNVSFSAADSDSEEYVAMFPDSTIAESFQQKAKKVKYMVQFGIALYFKELTLKSLWILLFHSVLMKAKNHKWCLRNIPIQSFFLHCNCISWNSFCW